MVTNNLLILKHNIWTLRVITCYSCMWTYEFLGGHVYKYSWNKSSSALPWDELISPPSFFNSFHQHSVQNHKGILKTKEATTEK